MYIVSTWGAPSRYCQERQDGMELLIFPTPTSKGMFVIVNMTSRPSVLATRLILIMNAIAVTFRKVAQDYLDPIVSGCSSACMFNAAKFIPHVLCCKN